MTTYIGIDIGKQKIYYAYPQGDRVNMEQGCFANNYAEIEAFIKKLPADSHCIMEATGLYHFPLAYSLQDAGRAFTVVNPAASSAYSKSFLSITKTDSRDAVMLQRFGQERQLPSMQLPEKEWQAFRQRIGLWQDLIRRIQVLKNRLGELNFHPKPDKLSVELMEQQLELLEEQLKKVEGSIYQDLPDDYRKLLENGQSIKGIGPKTASHLLFFTNGLKDFDSPKALAKYVGIAPNMYQSGGYQKAGRICRSGNALLRSLLYNCAKQARQRNTACKLLYDRLRQKGKPHKVAMVAVMHKLLKQFFAVIKSGIPYQDGHGVVVTTP